MWTTFRVVVHMSARRRGHWAIKVGILGDVDQASHLHGLIHECHCWQALKGDEKQGGVRHRYARARDGAQSDEREGRPESTFPEHRQLLNTSSVIRGAGVCSKHLAISMLGTTTFSFIEILPSLHLELLVHKFQSNRHWRNWKAIVQESASQGNLKGS